MKQTVKRILVPAIAAVSLSMHLAAVAAAPVIEVYKSAYCGCCTEWVKHLEKNGFQVKAQNVANPSDYREKAGIPNELGSCHTGMVNGYALEGHVPASEIKRLLVERPKAKGLAVPAMPMGSPGMEGDRSDPYDVLLVQADGRNVVYQHYDGKGSNVVAANDHSQHGAKGAAASASGQAKGADKAGSATSDSTVQSTDMTDGEVKKVDKDAGKITIKHGELKALRMPPMTMVFRVKEPAMLDQVKAGDKIKFVADKVGSQYTVTKLQAAQ